MQARQSWEGDKWAMIGKSSSNIDRKHDENESFKYAESSSSKFKRRNTRIPLYITKNSKGPKDKIVKDTKAKSRKSGKSLCRSQAEALSLNGRKCRAIGKEGQLNGSIPTNRSTFQNADPLALQRDLVGENYAFASPNNRRTGLSELRDEGMRPSGAAHCGSAVNLANGADSVRCSVGSCSVNSCNSYKLPQQVSAGLNDGTHEDCSDAESICHFACEEKEFFQEELAAEIHRLELHAYRRTLEALHASGPLSWEKEALITDLRLSLHISNDEHLIELKKLVSTDINVSVR